MTHTYTETYEERVWRMALEATDPASSEETRQRAQVELERFMPTLPEVSKKRIAAVLRLLVFQPVLAGVMP